MYLAKMMGNNILLETQEILAVRLPAPTYQFFSHWHGMPAATYISLDQSTFKMAISYTDKSSSPSSSRAKKECGTKCIFHLLVCFIFLVTLALKAVISALMHLWPLETGLTLGTGVIALAGLLLLCKCCKDRRARGDRADDKVSTQEEDSQLETGPEETSGELTEQLNHEPADLPNYELSSAPLYLPPTYKEIDVKTTKIDMAAALQHQLD